MKSPYLSIFASMTALFFSVGQVNAALVAYEDFNYTTSDGSSLTAVGNNEKSGGTGWGSEWQTGVAGVSGIGVSGSNASLYFDQDPALYADGSNHVFATGSRANKRDFSTGVSATSTYATLLVRSFIEESQCGGAQMRMQFYDGLGATGNMRANVGIDGSSLFVSATATGFSPVTGVSQSGLFADNTTYLLAMKRTGSNISAALIPVNGDLSILGAEPTWQVTHTGVTGVTFRSMLLVINGQTTSLRADELRVATTWDDAVAGVIPEPRVYALVFSLLCGAVVLVRRKKRSPQV
jgi:hypothetical protein